MIAEVISIGDELSSGQRLDTNSQWLSQKLGELGVRVLFHTTVGDDLASNVEVFQIASRRADLVLCTGGLGPTADDLTREAMAQAFGLALELDTPSLEHIEQLFSRRKRAMPERNRVQALFPSGAIPIPNPHGTAPGIDLKVQHSDRDSHFFALPGVPAEMKQMFEQTVVERLRSEHGVGTNQLFYRTIKLFGIGESDVEAKLPDLIHRDRLPRVGITVSQATITLRIATEAKDASESDRIMQPTVDEIYRVLGDLIFGEGEIEIQDAVIEQLQSRKEKLAIVEIGPESVMTRFLLKADQNDFHCLAGSIALRDLSLTDHIRRLDPLRSQSLYSTPVVTADSDPGIEDASLWMELAIKTQCTFQSDWVLVVGCYPEHRDVYQSNTIPTSKVTIAVLSPQGECKLRRFELGAHPDVLFDRIAKTAIDQLRRSLRKSS